MTPAIIHELCEMHLLYLGNCVFGELRQKPITAMLPAPVDLDTLQDRQVVFWDHNIREMYMYILPNLNSAQETST